MSHAFGFTVTDRRGRARSGELMTAHGLVRTPAFMPVATRGAVKGVQHGDLIAAGTTILLANTYHLHLRPGDDRIGRLGGLHRFVGWNLPMLTDSGGFQVYSLGALRRVDEEGVRFRSHLDGATHQLTPESAVDVQARLGADIAMVLDECLAYPASEREVRTAVERTARWAARARERFMAVRDGRVRVGATNDQQAQFGIVQGGVLPAWREASVEAALAVGFEGYAIGGLSVGEPPALMYDIVEHTASGLPADRPRYLMGVGTPVDLVESVARGIDLFDCVLPTRNARNGQLFTRNGRLNIKNARFADDERPPDPACGCPTCRTCSRAYLRHLFTVQEMNAATLNSLHNLYFYLDTLSRVREAIKFGSFEAFRQDFRRTYSSGSLES